MNTKLNKPPFPVIIVSILFIVAGSVGFSYHFKELYAPDINLYEILWVQTVRILAVLCGWLLLKSVNWARWLAIVWLVYHVVISAFHSTSQMITHIVVLLIVGVLLYLPKSSAFFQKV